MIGAMLARLRRLRLDRDGVTAMEYAMIAAGVVVAISNFMPGIGTGIGHMYSNVSVALSGPANTPRPPVRLDTD